MSYKFSSNKDTIMVPKKKFKDVNMGCIYSYENQVTVDMLQLTRQIY